jgi:hypothetical protein
MSVISWHPGPGVNWKSLYLNNAAAGYGTDFSLWPTLNDFGDATTARDIVIDPNANPVIQGVGATIPSACLPYGANGKDPDGAYVIQDIFHRGNIVAKCPQAQTIGKHIFPRTTVDTNGVSNFDPGPAICWVGTTEIAYLSRTSTQLRDCTGFNPWKRWEDDSTSIVQPPKVKLRYYRLSNRTPDLTVWENNDLYTGKIDNATRQNAQWDIQHFHQICAGTQPGPKGISWAGSHNSFMRNSFIECSLQDNFGGGFQSTGLRVWNSTLQIHPGAGTGGRHADGIQWGWCDNGQQTRRGLPTFHKVYMYGKANNAHLFTNPSGYKTYNYGLWFDQVLLGGNDPASPEGWANRPIHTGSAVGNMYTDCWFYEAGYQRLFGVLGIAGNRYNMRMLRCRLDSGALHPFSVDSYGARL